MKRSMPAPGCSASFDRPSAPLGGTLDRSFEATVDGSVDGMVDGPVVGMFEGMFVGMAEGIFGGISGRRHPDLPHLAASYMSGLTHENVDGPHQDVVPTSAHRPLDGMFGQQDGRRECRWDDRWDVRRDVRWDG